MAGESEFPYTPVPNSLRKLLEKIPTIGTPPKATQKWLAGVGFSGGNNQRSLAVLRQVGIIAQDGTPTDLWKALRAKDKATYASGIRRFYSGLFDTYPDAHRKDDEALLAYIRASTDYGESVQRLALRTFKVLCEPGDFGEVGASAGQAGGKEKRKGEKPDQGEDSKVTPRVVSSPVGLTVNIQLQLPPSDDGEVYDKLFEAMGKHLKGLIQINPDDE